LKKRSSRLTVFNRQRRFTVDTLLLRRFLERLSGRMGLAGGFSVVLLSERAMKRYNRRFRGKNESTDVLSFPDGQESDEGAYLGDVLVCVDDAHRQRRGALLEELKTLSLHGVLHLCGYDHEIDQGEMATLEARLKREFQLS